MIMAIIIFLLITLATGLVVGVLRSVSIRQNWVDAPTTRSSHESPVPNIGGVAMMGVILLVVCVLVAINLMAIEEAVFWIFIAGGLGITGFIDDIKDLNHLIRLAIHISVALAVTALVGGINSLNLGFTRIEFGVWAYLPGLIWVVGFVNMYNFMDGINGLAGAQAVIAGVVFALWFYHYGLFADAWLFIGVAAAAAGFLYWNITPARVFMGDSGSTMLGGLFAAASLKLHNQCEISIVFPALIFAWFLVDTSITFLKRLVRGENVWQAHRQHFYQQLASEPSRHSRVTGMISLITLVISLIISVILFKGLSIN